MPRSPCPHGQTRNTKTKVCRDKKKPGRKARNTRKSSNRSNRSNSSLSSKKSVLSKVKKLYGASFQVLNVKFAEDRIKDKKPVIGIDVQDWKNGDKTNMKVFHFIGFGERPAMKDKDLSSTLTDDNQTLHYMSGNRELYAEPAHNSANARTDNLCFGSGCNPIFVKKC